MQIKPPTEEQIVGVGLILTFIAKLARQLKARKDATMWQRLLGLASEPSTWRGLVWLITAAGVTLSPDQTGAIAGAGMAVAGAIGVFVSDGGDKNN
jgi:hypothetical protein